MRDPERVSLFINGEFRLGLPRQVVAERGLRVGQELSDAEIEALEALDEVSRATNQAVRLLSYRPRSRRELESRLQRKGFSELAIEEALGWLAERGYVDDEAFAQYWVENRLQNRPRGRQMIASELRAKGVPGGVVDNALAGAEIDEYGDALQLARRRAEQLRGLDDVAWRRRMGGYLQRRGYSWQVVRAVLDEIRSERDQ